MSCKYYYMLQDKKTPLHWACERGHSEVVTVLIAHGGDIEAQDKVNEYNLNEIHDFCNLTFDIISSVSNQRVDASVLNILLIAVILCEQIIYSTHHILMNHFLIFL